MRKETAVALGIVATVIVVVVLGWFLLAPEPVVVQENETELAEQSTVVEDIPESIDEDPLSQNIDNDVTRIIIESENEDTDISNILSEKVIINDEVVDKVSIPPE